MLKGHHGYDIGALELSKTIARVLSVPLYSSSITRLLIDLNRSVTNPKLFSDVTNRLAQSEKEAIIGRCYLPYHDAVELAVRKMIHSGERVLHLGAHTFTPVLRGRVRSADIGLLYDPSRVRETAFCTCWQRMIHSSTPDLAVRRNYPYQGKSDGFTAYLRDQFDQRKYLGVEIEVNQKHALGDRSRWLLLQKTICESLRTVLNSHS
jgi:predicted N-formylglutamate amidohydrolase